MNANILQSLTAWTASINNPQSITLISPLTFGEDGTCITFTVLFPSPDRFVITDFAEHMMLAESYGITLSKSRINQLNATYGIRMAEFNSDGEIISKGVIDDLQFALFDALKLALSLSMKIEKWLPKFQQLQFRSLVETALRQRLPEQNIIKDIDVEGITGHRIRFPLAIQVPEKTVYIETIGLQDGKLNWPAIYQAHGKFSDIKHTENTNKRLTIVENNNILTAASTLLAEVSSIQTYNNYKNWTLGSLAA